MISLLKPVSKHQISKRSEMHVFIHGKKVYCSVGVPFPIKEKGLYTPSQNRAVM